MEVETRETLHIAMIPTVGMGHLIPMAELSKKLVVYGHVSITFFIPNDGSSLEAQKQVLEDLPKSKIKAIFLPPVNLDDLPQGIQVTKRIMPMVTRSLPFLRESFRIFNQSKQIGIAAMVVDLFGTEAFALAKEFGAVPIIFFPSPTLGLSLGLHLPELDQTYSCEYRYLPEPVQLPGCVPLDGIDLVEPVQDRGDEQYVQILHLVKRYRSAAGIMVNSFFELEPGPFKALNEDRWGFPPVYPVGPLIQACSTCTEDKTGCLKWLEHQPRGSVLYISFGSGGTLSEEQTTELAHGLEMSRQRFIWVVKSPNREASGTYFTVKSAEDPLEFLPQAFLERTKGVGLVVPSWAPQIKILSHSSIGGFLTHCGWNSILESVIHGVPLIAWPLFGDQRMSAVLVSEDLKVATRVKMNQNGIVGRVEIANDVKSLMVGEESDEMRKRMRVLKEAAAMALKEGGSSRKSLAEVVQLIRKQKQKPI